MDATLSRLTDVSIFSRGGPVMYVLLLAAVIGLTFIFYCLFTLRRKSVMSTPLVNVAEKVTGPEDYDEALAICRREGGSFAEILASVIATSELPREESEAIVEGAGRRAMHDLSRGTLALEVVSGVSTMLGLMGTVSGMYNMMMTISESGIKDIGAISGGIGEALITTLAGLVIAIPTYVAFVYFSRRVEDVVLMMEEYAIHLMARIRLSADAEPAAGPVASAKVAAARDSVRELRDGVKARVDAKSAAPAASAAPDASAAERKPPTRITVRPKAPPADIPGLEDEA